MKPWEKKAHALIALYARQAWEQNKRRPGYRLPDIADALVRALGKNDEHEIKRLFEVERWGAWSLI